MPVDVSGERNLSESGQALRGQSEGQAARRVPSRPGFVFVSGEGSLKGRTFQFVVGLLLVDFPHVDSLKSKPAEKGVPFISGHCQKIAWG